MISNNGYEIITIGMIEQSIALCSEDIKYNVRSNINMKIARNSSISFTTIVDEVFKQYDIQKIVK